MGTECHRVSHLHPENQYNDVGMYLAYGRVISAKLCIPHEVLKVPSLLCIHACHPRRFALLIFRVVLIATISRLRAMHTKAAAKFRARIAVNIR